MATTASSTSSLSSLAMHSRSNPIDLTLDDDDPPSNNQYMSQSSIHPHQEELSLETVNNGFTPSSSLSPTLPMARNLSTPISRPLSSTISNYFPRHEPSQLPTVIPGPYTGPYRPVSAGFSPNSHLIHQPQPQPQHLLPAMIPRRQVTPQHFNRPPQMAPTHADAQVIDLTDSPSPPPSAAQNVPPGLTPVNPNDSPKTPVCIGQLTATALVLYPIPYLNSVNPNQEFEWAPVKFQYEHNPQRIGSCMDTIHIRTPHGKTPDGQIVHGENFAVIEQKVATALGSMLGKGLIRLDGRIRRGKPNLPILPLQMLVYTPKGNIFAVGNWFRQNDLLLDHPPPPYDDFRLTTYPYLNPHNPPPGGHNRTLMLHNRLTTPGIPGPPSTTRGGDAQRGQVDDLFKHLKDGIELQETEPSPDVATKLYPHQKKALTFLLDREREKPANEEGFSSLWQANVNPLSQQTTWVNIVTEETMLDEPKEAKGAILADDMGLGKTITCVSLIAATLPSARDFAAKPLEMIQPPPLQDEPLNAAQFAGSVWGMPDQPPEKVKSKKKQEKLEAGYLRACRIKTRSRATLIICPLSTVANWEDQFREHWRGEVTIVGGSGNGSSSTPTSAGGSSAPTPAPNGTTTMEVDDKQEKKQERLFRAQEKPARTQEKSVRTRERNALRVYIYHGNARTPDPMFLADFDAVITTYATLASEYSKQNKSSTASADDDDDADFASSDGSCMEVDDSGNPISRPPLKKAGSKRKKPMPMSSSTENSSPLQSIYWFRVVLDEAHSIKEPSTVGCRASCDLMADRRLCLTGTPVQNKLDDIYALVKFLHLKPFDDKNIWTKHISTPAKFGQKEAIVKLRMIMSCITLRRTKETKDKSGKNILSLPPRIDATENVSFDKYQLDIYQQFFTKTVSKFDDLSRRNEIMKNYVGILQWILRLRQICDHTELVENKGPNQSGLSYEDIVAATNKEGINSARANAIFSILRETAATQCTECGGELCSVVEGAGFNDDMDKPPPSKRGRKSKGQTSRAPTRANSPTGSGPGSGIPRPILTRCQHLFCLECYRMSICPDWPNVPPDLRRLCSVCQTELLPSDAVEIGRDVITETLSTDGKKLKKETKEERKQRLDRKMQDLERRLQEDWKSFQEKELYNVESRETTGVEESIKNELQELKYMNLESFPSRDYDRQELEQKGRIEQDEEALRGFGQQTQDRQRVQVKREKAVEVIEIHDDDVEEEMRLQPDAFVPAFNARVEAVKIMQQEMFERSTKLRQLISKLMPYSKLNPYSTNYNPAEINDPYQIDRDGSFSLDNIVKTVVFSQWTSMLDKIEDALLLHNIRYDRLDGTMKREERARAMDALKNDPGCEVLLVSLKAGGVGLNLTAAQQVIIMDPYWNPAVEQQAIDRIHRLGQTKPVQSFRFVVKGSIEDKLIKIQEKKIMMAEMTLGVKSKAEIMQRRMEELRILLNPTISSP